MACIFATTEVQIPLQKLKMGKLHVNYSKSKLRINYSLVFSKL